MIVRRKSVSLAVDATARRNLGKALQSVSELASATITCVDKTAKRRDRTR
jgi:hypothetical protein